jgi:cysteine/O-acetylserine efflux protein
MPNLAPFLVYVFVTTFTPGPNNILAMSNAMRSGYRRTLGFLTGMLCGFTLVMLACGLLNVVLVSFLPKARPWLNLAAAAYLVYLAVHTFLSRPPGETVGKTGLNTFPAGLTLQFVNLKVILYGVTVFSLFISSAFKDPWIVSLFAPALALVGFVASSCWAVGGAVFSNFWRSHYRVFNLVMGTFLLYSAAAALFEH